MGRVATCEIMVMTGRVHDMIMDPKQTGMLGEVVAEGGYYGMQTFDQHLLEHLQAGRITLEEATRVASSPHDFKLMVAAQARISPRSHSDKGAGRHRGPAGRQARRRPCPVGRRRAPGAVRSARGLRTPADAAFRSRDSAAAAPRCAGDAPILTRPGGRPGPPGALRAPARRPVLNPALGSA